MTNQKPHVHKDLIIAWANGAEIQFYDGWNGWKDIKDGHFWTENAKYRIKPELKKVKFRNYLYKVSAGDFYVFAVDDPSIEKDPYFVKWVGDWQEIVVEE